MCHGFHSPKVFYTRIGELTNASFEPCLLFASLNVSLKSILFINFNINTSVYNCTCVPVSGCKLDVETLPKKSTLKAKNLLSARANSFL